MLVGARYVFAGGPWWHFLFIALGAAFAVGLLATGLLDLYKHRGGRPRARGNRESV
jgi:hypothetical protein